MSSVLTVGNRPNRTISLALGLIDGVIAIAVVNATYALMSSGGGPYRVVWWLALPFGSVVAWRGARFVRRLQRDTAPLWIPAAEGFALLFVACAVWLLFEIGRGIVAGAPGAGQPAWLILPYVTFYATAAGLYGALVGLLLGALNTLTVRVLTH